MHCHLAQGWRWWCKLPNIFDVIIVLATNVIPAPWRKKDRPRSSRWLTRKDAKTSDDFDYCLLASLKPRFSLLKNWVVGFDEFP